MTCKLKKRQQRSVPSCQCGAKTKPPTGVRTSERPRPWRTHPSNQKKKQQSLDETLKRVQMAVQFGHDEQFKDEPQSVHPPASKDEQDQGHLLQHSWIRSANRREGRKERSPLKLLRAQAKICIVGSECQWRRSRARTTTWCRPG